MISRIRALRRRGAVAAAAGALLCTCALAPPTAVAAAGGTVARPLARPDGPATPGAFPRSAGTTGLGAFRAAGTALPKPLRAGDADHQVLVVLGSGADVTGAPLAARSGPDARAPRTSDATVTAALGRIGADGIRPLLPGLPTASADGLRAAARGQLGANALDLSKVQVVHLRTADAAAAARTLAATPGVAFAEPDQSVSPMDTGAVPLPSWTGHVAIPAAGAPAAGAGLPGNYGLASSLESYLDAGGVDAMGAYSTLQQRFGQLPGTGETITNVSIGDLTDAGMAAAGDPYVQANGPTTIISGGQRYLDIPSMPLIPTYTADAAGALDPTGSAEDEDPQLDEVLLDFSVMAPLPHTLQRAGAQGSGDTDLLGIAPGANYRLVVPTDPTLDQIAVALLAAARQTPRPDVITASLGLGTDQVGFPGRYLEDDPIVQAVVAAITRQYGITVVISSNDGTRLYTNASVGPDGGSTPTDLAPAHDPGAATSTDDDASSTTPSIVPDSGAIAAGATTTDDTLAVPPRDEDGTSTGTWATTRTDGSGDYSSGFGTRVDVSAPGDDIPALEHSGQTAESVLPVLNGGTSASAPEIAAAAAVVLQVSRLTGRPAAPAEVRSLLERTGRAVPTPPQIDRTLHVGPQLDLTAAVESLLDRAGGTRAAAPRIVRIAVTHRITTGELGGAYTEATDPDVIDLQGPGTGTAATGEGLVGPVTIGADVTGLPAHGRIGYALRVGTRTFTSATPAVRLMPAQLLAAAALPVIATGDRTVPTTFEVLDGKRVVASAAHPLTLGPTDGTYDEARAPSAPATVPSGRAVSVGYDLTGVRNLSSPELVVSTVGHWNPALAPIFTAAYSVALTGTTGHVTVPASAFDGGGGLYGIGIVQRPGSTLSQPVYGEFASIRVEGGTAAQRPAAPTLATGAAAAFGHQLTVTRAAPGFRLRYDVRGIRGATGALLEVSAPAPNLYGSLDTVDNPNGSVPDHDGVDTPATLDKPLPGTAGTRAFDALDLGLGSSLAYDVRVFATGGHGAVLGQASPVSLLTVDDGRAPDGATVSSFAIAPGATSVAATDDPAGGAAVYDYDAATGRYGARLTADPAAGAHYDVFGVDTGDGHTLVLHMSAAGDDLLETYDTGDGHEIGTPVDLGAYTVDAGRVDPARHEGAVLVQRRGDDADLLLPVDLGTGAAGAPIPLDTTGEAGGSFRLMDLDASTGTVYTQREGTGGFCLGGVGGATVDAVDLATAAVTPAPIGVACASGIADDQHGHLDELWYRSFSVNFPGTTLLASLPTDPPAAAPALPVDSTQQGLTLAVDGTHGLALVAFDYPVLTSGGRFGDNDATSRFAVVDTTSGATVGTVTGVETRTPYFGGELDPPNERNMQLDPATRTGWTYSVDGTQIQQFSY